MPFPSQERFSWRPWAGLAIGLATSLALWTGHAEEPKHPLSVGPALLPEKTDTGSPSPAENRRLESLKFALSTARFDASTRDYVNAEKNYLLVLAEDSPDEMQKTALFELGVTVQAENDLPRAQSIFSQYQQRWSGDARAPEICLHQGQIFRGMGMNQMALSKFYSVMTSALSIKDDQLPNYKRLVLQAQVEIAETHYLIGKYAEASEYYARLLKQGAAELDMSQVQYRLVRSLVALKHFEEASSQAQDFLAHHADAAEAPEVRYDLAQALKGQGRDNEALQQVLLFLKEEREKTKAQPEVWTYWQQRVGNEIGNALYQQGDFMKALEVYTTLAKLDPTPEWQLPVNYQVAITYERLLQPVNAIGAYRTITNAAIGAEWFPWKNVGIGAEYASTRIRLKQKDDAATARVRLELDGPAVYLRMRF